MEPEIVTSTTLIEGLRDPGNRTLWAGYVERYRPLLVGYARRLGLSDDDAEDVAQGTLLAFAEGVRDGRYARERGRLSSWLFGIATNQARAAARGAGRRAAQEPATESTGPLARLEAEDELEETWEREWRGAVLRACLAEIRREVEPRTMRAFELSSLEERPAAEVAAELGMSPNAVYIAKHRVLSRVRDLLPLMTDAW